MSGRIQELAEQRRQLKAQQRANQKEIKKAQRKRKDILSKARTLSDADLLSVVAARAAAKAKAKAGP